MSFALKPINPKIQQVLESKSKILSRDTSALGTQGGMPNKLNEVQGRSPWIRWISGDLDPIVILGGVGINDGGVGYSLAKGFKEVYVPPNSTAMIYSPSQQRHSGPHFKPLAGVKSVTTSFEGGTKALRKTVVTWTVFDLDELEVLTPHFLSPGKWCMLEVGWNYDGKTFTNLVGNKFFEVKDGTGNAPAKPKYDKFEDLGSLDEIIYANGGDYDVFSGIITNFEYSVRDDGGFDCTTTFATHGISLLEAGKDTTTFTVDTALEKVNLTDDASAIGRLEQDNINIAMQKLATYFRVMVTYDPKDEPRWKLNNSRKLSNVNDIDGTADFYGPGGSTNWFTYAGVKGKTSHKGKDKEEFKGLQRDTTNSEFTNGRYWKQTHMTEDTPAASWVRWGWFEDNILSKYAGYASMTTDEEGKVTGINEVKLKFRSIEDVLATDGNGIIGQKVKIDDIKGNPSTDKNAPTKKESVRILSHGKLLTTDVNKFILIGKTDSLEEDDNALYSNLGKFLKNAPISLTKYNFKVPDEDSESEIEEGYIRNIFFNVRWLQEQFKGVGTLREVIDNIWNAFNAEYQNYWQFDVVGDINDTSIARLIDKNNSRYSVDKFQISKIDLKNPNPPISKYGCYQFPTWTKDSIVSNMDYSVTIPTSQVAVAALAGGKLDANKIAQRNRGDIDVQTFVKSMSKSFEDRKERFFDNTTRIAEYTVVSSVAKFGQIIGDENKILAGNKGPDILGTLLARDKDLANAKINERKIKQIKEIKDDGTATYIRSAHAFFKTPIAGDAKITDWSGKVSLYSNGVIQSEGTSDYISVMLGIMHTSPTESKGALTDLLNGIATIQLTIDGTAGIFPGDAFTSKHLPRHLLRPLPGTTKIIDGKEIGGKLPLLFQVTNVQQSISPDGWKTEITGQPRMNHNHIYNKTKAESDYEILKTRLFGTVVAGQITDNGIVTRLDQNRNILGINRKYLKRLEMFMGITEIIKDEYFDTISSTHGAGTPFAQFQTIINTPTDDGKVEWKDLSDQLYTWEERCSPANFENRQIEEVMRFAMYSGILYAMPDEQTHNNTRDPYSSIDKTFQCVSYNLFKGDKETMSRWETAGSADSITPTYTQDYIEQMEEDLKKHNTLNKNGEVATNGIVGLYTPMAILRRGKDIMNKFLGSYTLKPKGPWTEDSRKYQELFTFGKKTTLTIDISWWPDKTVDAYNLKIKKASYQIWFDFFKGMFDSYLGEDWDKHCQLIEHPTSKTETWRGDEEGLADSGKIKSKERPNQAIIQSLFNDSRMFKHGIDKFSVVNEIHKFLKHMVDEGFEFSPKLIWWKSLDFSDNNLDWFGVASKKDSFNAAWDKEYIHSKGNATWQIYPYEGSDEGKKKIKYASGDNISN